MTEATEVRDEVPLEKLTRVYIKMREAKAEIDHEYKVPPAIEAHERAKRLYADKAISLQELQRGRVVRQRDAGLTLACEEQLFLFRQAHGHQPQMGAG